jgi:hypothetical protein
MKSQTAQVEKWQIYNNRLYGIVKGHPVIADGRPIISSQIVKLDEEKNICETLNTIYRLGKPFDQKVDA